MKRLMIIIPFIMLYHDGNAQNFNEWFQQKKTQKEYLIQQIAAFQVYMDYLQKGYSISRKGLTVIGDIKNRELGLHEDYFSSLKEVNPAIKNYVRVAQVIFIERKIMLICHKTIIQIKQNEMLRQEEKDYIARVFDRLLDDCKVTLEELNIATATGNLEMTDDERITRIDNLHDDMVDKYSFLNYFSGQVQILANARINEASEIKKIQLIEGLKNEER